jgi:ABC-2 type transport system permease protein
MMRVIIDFIRKEFLQFWRDKKMLNMVLFAPVIQLVLLGYAATMDVESIQTVVFDHDRSQTSRELVDKFEKSGYFSVDYYATSYDEIIRLIDKGDALLAVVIPFDFEKNIQNRKTAKLQAIFDGSDGNKGSIAAGYAQGITASYSQSIMFEYLEKSGMKIPISGSIEPEVRVWYNPDLTTRYYMIPALTCLLIMLVTTSLTSLAVIKEREIGTLEQLIVTPIKPYQLILGKTIPFTILGLISSTIVFSVMRYWFGIEIRGSLLFLYFSAVLFMLSTLGLGLFVSTITKTQMQAMITSAFGIIMPMIFLSGFAFPIENMPPIIQYFTYLVPPRYFISLLRGIILKGTGIREMWTDTLLLFAFGVFILTISSLRFRKKFE